MSPAALGWVRALALAVLIVVLDQVTKAIAADALGPGESVDLLLGFELVDVRNT